MAKQANLFSFFNKTATPPKLENKSKIVKLNGSPLTELTIVWAKVEGHPWWPGLVCNAPSSDSFVKGSMVHIQFFETPPTRGWVKENFIKSFGDPMKVGVPSYKDSSWKKARILAEEAQLKSKEERKELIVEHLESEEEMEEEDASSHNSSKENIDDSNLSASESKKRNNSNGEVSSEPQKKKRRIVLKSESEDSDADAEYKPEKDISSDESVSSGEDESKISEPEVSEPEVSSMDESPSPVKVKKTPRRPSSKVESTPQTPRTPVTPSASTYSPSTSGASPALKNKLALFAAKEAHSDEGVAANAFSLSSLPFLLPENIKDLQGRRPSDPDYDRRTLYVPESFLNQQTPGHRQWWDFKKQHFDTVLFFKMGKFYELFYMDAEIGVQELGLLLMKGTTPHSGFPEISYGRFSASLLEKGYKVARIEQTETPDMMEKRCKALSRCTKFDRVVRREVCQLTGPGTRVYGVQDAEPTTNDPSYLLAITVRGCDSSDSGECVQCGVAFIDTSLGVFHLGQFTDDRYNSRLRTLLAHYPPVQILTERHKLPTDIRQILSQYASGDLLECLSPETEFWTASKTLEFLAEDSCFKKEGDEGTVLWPDCLQALMEKGSFSPVEGKSELSLSCLGAIVWYLKRCLLHMQLLTARNFVEYLPPDSHDELSQGSQRKFKQRTMVIDGGSANTLELVQNDSTGSSEGTLFHVLDHTSTPMGRRLLQQWLLAPLLSKAAIDDRLDAVNDLKLNSTCVEEALTALKRIPDVERLLAKIHSQGLKYSLDDPNSRAILFEEQQFGKRRVQCFLSALDAFKVIITIPKIFKDADISSKLLQKIVRNTENGGKMPLLQEVIKFFDNAFDHDRAKKEGKIIPCGGVDKDYDEALETIKATKDELDENLREEGRHFGAKVVYFGSDRKRYQLEVPESVVKKAGSNYELVSQRKGFKRFYTPRCKELLAQMIAAEEAKDVALKDIARRIFYQFDEKKALWMSAVECVKVLDVLLSFTRYSNSVESIRPEIVELGDEEDFIEIREGTHPCMNMSQEEIIANDVVLGTGGGDGAHSPLVLVTGPNMGGKSTLMRQTALLTIMAQIGCYVPCTTMRLSPVDRIFTRVGASDRMLAGESTFLVELRETASILQHATPHALVLVDELGRGTATHDGTAVAWGVASALIKKGCRTLFSTHYHGLVHHFSNTPGVSMGHMACMVEGEEDDETASEETITFLYKFAPGVCPKSYGFNAARLAEVPQDVVRKARQVARRLEGITDALSIFKKLMQTSNSIDEKKEAIKSVPVLLKAVLD